jgi:hypothetical protein
MVKLFPLDCQRAFRTLRDASAGEQRRLSARKFWPACCPCWRISTKLLNRIEQLHFPAQDLFRRDVQAAYDRVHGLRVALHYMVCNAQKRERESPTGNYELCGRTRKG